MTVGNFDFGPNICKGKGNGVGNRGGKQVMAVEPEKRKGGRQLRQQQKEQ